MKNAIWSSEGIGGISDLVTKRPMSQSGFNENLIVQKGFARMGGLSRTYYDIAEQAYESFLLENANRLPQPAADEDPTDLMDQEARIRTAGITTIVFAAMCLEAAAFDFAATQLSDAYTEQYIDKLDLVSKWVVVPKLVSGKSLEEAGAALNALRVLVRTRNSLVHQKSLPFDHKNLAIVEKASEAFPNSVHNAFKAVVLLSLELNEKLGLLSSGLPVFEKHVRKSHPPPPHVKRAIEGCRVVYRALQRSTRSGSQTNVNVER